MSAADLFGPTWISLWATGAALVALAAWLFLLDVASRPQRVFALLLALRGLTFFFGPLQAESETARQSTLWASLAPYATIPLAPLVLAFLCLYPRRRGLARTRWGLWALLAATLALEAWYLVDHAVHATVEPGTPARFTSQGPLFLATALRLPAFALAGLVLAGDYRRSPKGSAGFSLFLMVAAFTLNGLYDGMLATLDLARDLQDPATVWLPWAWARSVLPVLALPLSAAACLRILPVLRAARSDPELQEVTRFFAVAVPLALASAFLSLLPTEHLEVFVLGFWRLAIPLMLAYALLRYQLFSIDLRIKAGVRRGILVAVFVGVFFLISEAAEAIVSSHRAPLFGVVSASALAVLGKPIQAFAERAANGVMPDTKPVERLGSQGRFRLYREQFLLVQQDGRVTPKERRMLARLAAFLGVSDDEAMDLEAGLTPARDEPAPPKPRRSASRAARSVAAVLATAAAFGAMSAVLESLLGASSFLAGLATAALVALLLGPIEGLADRLTRRRPLPPHKEAALREALRDAWADGSLSERDVAYLATLQKRLGVGRRDRARIEADVRRALAA